MSSADVPFFLVSISSNSAATIRQLAEFEACQRDGHKVCHMYIKRTVIIRYLLKPTSRNTYVVNFKLFV